ncbi:hypothetical protein [Escherichia coli]|uniref:hypothetical protein n=1 Tax=Escherichia coli TaxID=562 RepID=UPI0039DF7FFA
MVARPADAGAGLFKLVTPDDGLLNGQRGEWSVKWRMMCEGLDPLAPADENRLAKLPPRGPIISTTETAGLHFIKKIII